MCGIFGWQYEKAPSDALAASIATALSIFNEQRGSHSWGFASSNGSVHRGVGPITHGLDARELARHRCVIVHTRFKTHGAITLDNAHPFKIGKLTGAHNGCIWNAEDLNDTHNRKFAVDSMHVFAHLDEQRDLRELVGYGAIEYFDASDPRGVYIGKFDSGELAAARIRGVGVVWSSERDHLALALQLAGADIERWYKLKSKRLYVARNGELQNTGRRLPINDWYQDTTPAKAEHDYIPFGLGERRDHGSPMVESMQDFYRSSERQGLDQEFDPDTWCDYCDGNDESSPCICGAAFNVEKIEPMEEDITQRQAGRRVYRLHTKGA